MKVLITAVNREKFPDPVFPLGASYIAHAVESAGKYNVQVFDACFEENPQEAFKEKIKAFMPDVVGFSIRNVDNNAFPIAENYLPYYQSMMKVIRENCSAKVIVGGSAYTIFPEYFLNELGADYGIAGEGEYSFVSLLEQIEAGSVKKGTIIKSTEIKDINFDTFPSRNGFDVAGYYQKGGCINIQTKRGCAFDCSYCTYPTIEGHKYRLRSPKNIVDEIQHWTETADVRHFYFVDSVFNHPEKYSIDIINEIVRRNLKIQWTGFFAPIFTDEFTAACKTAGLTSMDLGTDAFCDTTLKGYHKFFTVDDIFRSCELCRKYDIKYNHSMIFGGPGETMETLAETVKNIDASDPDSIIGFVGVRLYPNTPILDDVGIDDVGIEPEFYISPAVKDEIIDYLLDACSTRKNWIVPGLEKGVNMKLFERMRKKGIKGQLWELMKSWSR